MEVLVPGREEAAARMHLPASQGSSSATHRQQDTSNRNSHPWNPEDFSIKSMDFKTVKFQESQPQGNPKS